MGTCVERLEHASLSSLLLQIPSVPVIFGLRNALFLEQPSSYQRQFVKNLEEQRMHMNETERERLKKQTSKILKSADISDTPDEHDGPGDNKIETTLLKAKRARNATDVKDKVQFKRKRPKVLTHSLRPNLNLSPVLYAATYKLSYHMFSISITLLHIILSDSTSFLLSPYAVCTIVKSISSFFLLT